MEKISDALDPIVLKEMVEAAYESPITDDKENDNTKELKELLLNELDKAYGEYVDTDWVSEGDAVYKMVEIAKLRDIPDKSIKKNIPELLNRLYDHDDRVLNYVTAIVNKALDVKRFEDIRPLVSAMAFDNSWSSNVPVDDIMKYLETNRGISYYREDDIKYVINRYIYDTGVSRKIRKYLNDKEIKYHEQMVEDLTEIYRRYNDNSEVFAEDPFEHQMSVVMEDYRSEHIDDYSIPVIETPEYIDYLECRYSILEEETRELKSTIKRYKAISAVGIFAATASIAAALTFAAKLLKGGK